MNITRSTPEGLYRLKGANQVVLVGDVVYLSGLVGLKGDGTLAGDDVEAQVHQTYENMKTALSSAGADLSRVVKTVTYLTDLSQHLPVQKYQVALFGDEGPANSTVIVTGLARPELLLEIEAIAYLKTHEV